jgi:N-acetylneuraminic acid mutarotase
MTTRRQSLLTLSSALSSALLVACGGGGGGALAETVPPAPPPPVPPPAPPAGWTRLADLPAGRAKFGAAAVAGKVVAAGGYDTLRSVLVYDVASNAWSNGPSLISGTDNVAVLAVGGRVHAIGGEARTAHQVLDAALGAWASAPASPAIRFASAAAVLNGRLHLVGGWNYSNTASNSVDTHDVYDPATSTWSAAAPLATRRNAAAAAVVDGKLYVIGGRAPGIRASDQTSLASVEVYDPATNTWRAGPDLPQARSGAAAVALGGKVYVLGGESTPGGVRNTVSRLDPATGSWTELAGMPFSAHGLAAVVVDEAIVVMGGFSSASDAVGTESAQCWRFAPGAA